jgi:hypothetical protein
MSPETKKINILTYSIFTVLFSLYFVYLKSYLLSSVFLVYSVLFISLYIKKIKHREKFDLIFSENHKLYLLNLGFMLSWLIIYIIDLKSFITAFELIEYSLLGATSLVVVNLYYKMIIIQK